MDAKLVSRIDAQIHLRATQQGVAVIPKSNNYDRLVANLQCTSFDLSEEETKAVSGLNINLRVSSCFWYRASAAHSYVPCPAQ